MLFCFLVFKYFKIIFQKTDGYCEAQGSFFYNSSDVCNDKSGTCQATTATIFEQLQEIYPNIALLSAFLMIGTFYISYSLRAFKSGKFLGRTVSNIQKTCMHFTKYIQPLHLPITDNDIGLVYVK